MPGPFFLHNMGAVLEGARYKGDSKYFPISPDEAAKFEALYQVYNTKLKALKGKHQGETVHIFGSGPSLNDHAKNLDWTGKLTIGVNGVPFVINALKYWLMVDDFIDPPVPSELYTEIGKWVQSSPATMKLVRQGIVKRPSGWLSDVMFRHSSGPGSEPHTGLFWWNSSVQAAIDLARHMGVAEIYLWGVDYQDSSHAYGINDSTPKAKNFDAIQAQFKIVGDACMGIKIFNCNPNSRLKVFPFVEPSSVIPLPLKQPSRSITIDLDAKTVSVFADNILNVRAFDQLPSQKSLKKLISLLEGEVLSAARAS
jgi:hypothetical protein